MSPIMHEGQYLSRVGPILKPEHTSKLRTQGMECAVIPAFFLHFISHHGRLLCNLDRFYKFRHVNLCLKPKENSGVNE